MNTLEKHIRSFGGGLPRSVETDLSYELLAYLFGVVSLNYVQKSFAREGIDFDRKARHAVMSDPDVLYNVKFPLYYLAGQNLTVKEARQVAKEQGLYARDTLIVDMALEGGLKDKLDALRSKYRPLSIGRFKREAQRAWEENKKSLANYVFFELRFLSNWGLSYQHLAADCAARAYEAILLQYPRIESRLHLHNLYKQAAKQYGSKIIKHYTAKSRTVFNDDGTLRRFSLDYEDGADSMLSEVDTLCGLFGSSTRDETEVLSVRQFLRNPKLTQEDETLFLYLIGETDQEFEKWLQAQGVSKRNPAAYLNACCRYLGISHTHLADLRSMLEGKVR